MTALDLLSTHLLAAATYHARRAARLAAAAESRHPNVGRHRVGTRPTRRTPGQGRAGRSAPAVGGPASPPTA